MFRSASLFIGTSFTVAVFTIFATANVDSIVGIPHKIYSTQRILIRIKANLFVKCAHLHPGYEANLVARSRYCHCHWTVLEKRGLNIENTNSIYAKNCKAAPAFQTLNWTPISRPRGRAMGRLSWSVWRRMHVWFELKNDIANRTEKYPRGRNQIHNSQPAPYIARTQVWVMCYLLCVILGQTERAITVSCCIAWWPVSRCSPCHYVVRAWRTLCRWPPDRCTGRQAGCTGRGLDVVAASVCIIGQGRMICRHGYWSQLW